MRVFGDSLRKTKTYYQNQGQDRTSLTLIMESSILLGNGSTKWNQRYWHKNIIIVVNQIKILETKRLMKVSGDSHPTTRTYYPNQDLDRISLTQKTVYSTNLGNGLTNQDKRLKNLLRKGIITIIIIQRRISEKRILMKESGDSLPTTRMYSLLLDHDKISLTQRTVYSIHLGNGLISQKKRQKVLCRKGITTINIIQRRISETRRLMKESGVSLPKTRMCYQNQDQDRISLIQTMESSILHGNGLTNLQKKNLVWLNKETLEIEKLKSMSMVSPQLIEMYFLCHEKDKMLLILTMVFLIHHGNG